MGDIQMATQLARAMVMEWGMSDKLGRVRYQSNEQEVFLGHSLGKSSVNLSDETAKQIDEEVRSLIEEGEQTARRILLEKEADWEALAQGLLEYETLSGEEIRDLLAGKPPVRENGDTPSNTVRSSSVPSTRPRPRDADDGTSPETQLDA